MDRTYGFVKVVADKKNGEILGMQIVGANASMLISEASHSIEMAAFLEDLARNHASRNAGGSCRGCAGEGNSFVKFFSGIWIMEYSKPMILDSAMSVFQKRDKEKHL
ncbi:Dihydrolipoyl dehydrogenase [uncultured archaeon]|nr:Dihydrolipoyl dehydrogenase [uncultured archaeon]